MTQLVKCLSCKHENLSSVAPQTPMLKVGHGGTRLENPWGLQASLVLLNQ